MADRNPRSVLFVTHTSEWTGPNASLVQLLAYAPSWMKPLVLLSGDGPLSDALERLQIGYFLVGKPHQSDEIRGRQRPAEIDAALVADKERHVLEDF